MYGWRGRIGLIIPSSNVTMEPEFRFALPDGISLHTTRMELADQDITSLETTHDLIRNCSSLLTDAGVDIIAYGCTLGSLITEPAEIEKQITEITGLPSVATGASIKRALDRLELKELTVVTPYEDELNEIEKAYLEGQGYEVKTIDGLGADPSTEMGQFKHGRAYRHAKQFVKSDVDGVLISCTDYKTIEIIQQLEADINLPVVTSNQATLWDALRKLNIDYSDLNFGELFRSTDDR